MKKIPGLLALACILSLASFSQATLQSITDEGNSTTNLLLLLKQSGGYGLNVTNQLDADLLLGVTAAGVPEKYAWIQSSLAGRNLVLNHSNGGNVGIGTTSPASKLAVLNANGYGVAIADNAEVINGISNSGYSHLYLQHVGNNGNLFLVNGGGKVGIGLGQPSVKLHIFDAPSDAGAGSMIIGPTNGSNLRMGYNNTYSWIQSHGGMPLHINELGNNTILNLNAGNVGIGTNNPGTYKLAVEGIIGARKVKVTQDAWADYVFDSSYQLIPLPQVEKYIQEHKHLPDVPAAAEVKKEGLDLGGNQALLLKKIEELTLYILQQHKELQSIKEEVKDLRSLVK